MEHRFYLGQIISGVYDDACKFEIISLDPLKVKCLEVSKFWQNRGKKDANGNWLRTHGNFYRTWVVDEEYKLTMGNSEPRNFNFEYDLPWCSCYENGTFCHYR